MTISPKKTSSKQGPKLSVSDRYLRKSNRYILAVGLIMLFLFLIGLLYLSSSGDMDSGAVGNVANETGVGTNVNPPDNPYINDNPKVTKAEDIVDLIPKTIALRNIQIGTRADSSVQLSVKQGKALKISKFDDTSLANVAGLQIENDCKDGIALYTGDNCTISISWIPESEISVSGNLNLMWTEENMDGFIGENFRSLINVELSSVDKASGCNPCTPTADPKKEPNKIAIGFNDKYLGKVDFEGKLLDEMDVVLGRILSDGTALSLNSDVIGIAVNLGGVIDNNGNFIGNIIGDGTVIDKDGNALGKVFSDYTVKDVADKVIGYPVPRGTVIDNFGNVVGEVSSNGSVLSNTGKELGKIRKDGIAYGIDGKSIIGSIAPQGLVVAPGCRTAGVALSNGTVVDGFKRNVGKIMSDGTVIDRNGNIIALLLRGGLVSDKNGERIGTISTDGSVLDSSMKMVGCLLPSGDVADETNHILGGVIPLGATVFDACMPQGRIVGNGTVVDPNNKQLGKVNFEGFVVDENKNKIGYATFKQKHGLHTNIGGEDDVLYGTYFPRQLVSGESCRVYGKLSDNAKVAEGCVDKNGYLIGDDKSIKGALAFIGNVLGKDSKISGQVGSDGRVIDKKGKYVGCTNFDGSVTNESNINGAYLGEVAKNLPVISDKGKIIGHAFINGQVYNNEGNTVGQVLSGGIVVDKDGNVVGKTSKKGIVVDNVGKLVGRIDVNGLVENVRGEEIGIVLPDGTAVSKNGQIIGRFFGQYSYAVGHDNELLGMIDDEGRIKYKGIIASVRADGSIVDNTGENRGGVVPKGLAYSFLGKLLGRVTDKGGVKDSKNVETGMILSNGLFINNSLLPIGQVAEERNLFISNDGKVSGYTIKGNSVFDTRGKEIGFAMPNGLVVNSDGNIIGNTIKEGVVIDNKGVVLGYTNFAGDVVNFKDEKIGKILSGGYAINNDGNYIGGIIPKGSVISNEGKLLGMVSPDGTIADYRGYNMGRVLPNGRVVNANGNVIGGVLKQGLVVDNIGDVIGISLLEGDILDKKGSIVGKILANGTATDGNMNIIGKVIPFGAVAVDNYGDIIGFVDEKSAIKGKDGKILKVNARGYVLDGEGRIVGEIVQRGMALDSLGSVIGHVMADGSVYNNSDKIGQVVAGGYVIDKNKQVIGSVVKEGILVDSFGQNVGFVDVDGAIINDSLIKVGNVNSGGLGLDKNKKPFAKLISEDIVMSLTGKLLGRLYPNGVVQDNSNVKIGKVLADGIVVDDNGNLIGGVIKSGSVFKTDGTYLGFVGLDGLVYNVKKTPEAKSLPDGTVSGYGKGIENVISPIIGYVTNYGIPLNKENRAIGYVALDGSIVGKNSLVGKAYNNDYVYEASDVVGIVSPMEAIVNKGCVVLGAPSFTGNIFDNKGEDIGRLTVGLLAIDKDNSIIGSSRMAGTVINNSCQVVGYSGPDGKAVDKNFRQMGCVGQEGIVNDDKGNAIGFVAPRGVVVNLDEQSVLGRVTLEGQSLDNLGMPFGCVKQPSPPSLDYMVSEVGGPNVGKVFRNRFFTEQRSKIIAESRIKRTGPEKVDDKKENVPDLIADLTAPDGTKFEIVDDKIVDRNGNTIYGPDCNPLKVNSDGRVFDYSGKEIKGKIFKKLMIGEDGKSVVDEYGNKALASDGSVLTIDASGNLTAENNKLITTTDKKPVSLGSSGIVSSDGSSVYVGLDGSIMTEKGDILYQRGCKKKVVGIALGLDGKELGSILEDGTVVDEKGVPFAMVKNGVLLEYDKDEETQVYVESKDEDIVVRQRTVSTGGHSYVGPGQNPPPPVIVPTNNDLYGKEARDALLRKQIKRRGMISLSRVNHVVNPKKEYKDWTHAGFDKIISSHRINTDRIILKGKAIPAVLTVSIMSTMTDNPVQAVVDRNIFGEGGREIIIPAGSKLIGKANGGSFSGANGGIGRIAIVWERLVRPDGVLFNIQGATTGDSQGRGGAIGYVDKSLLKRYGIPLLSALSENAILVSMARNADGTVTLDQFGNQAKSEKAVAREDANDSLTDRLTSINQMIMDDLNAFRPILTVPAGTRITAYANKDLFIRTQEDDDAILEAEKKQAGAEGKEGATKRTFYGTASHREKPKSGSGAINAQGGGDNYGNSGNPELNPGAYQGQTYQGTPQGQNNQIISQQPQLGNTGSGNINQGVTGSSYYQGAPGTNNVGGGTYNPPPTSYQGGDYNSGNNTANNTNSGKVVEGENVPRLF